MTMTSSSLPLSNTIPNSIKELLSQDPGLNSIVFEDPSERLPLGASPVTPLTGDGDKSPLALLTAGLDGIGNAAAPN